MIGFVEEDKAEKQTSKKICPLQQRNEATVPKDTHCKEEKCAWWNSSFKMCNVIIEGYIAGVKWSASE